MHEQSKVGGMYQIMSDKREKRIHEEVVDGVRITPM